MPSHKGTTDVDVVVVVSACVGSVTRIAIAIVTGRQLNATEKVALQLEIDVQTKAKTPAVARNIRILILKSRIGKYHLRMFIPLITEPEISAQLQLLDPIPDLKFAGRNSGCLLDRLGADFLCLLVGQDAFPHQGVE